MRVCQRITGVGEFHGTECLGCDDSVYDGDVERVVVALSDGPDGRLEDYGARV